ncbi:MAG TPA: pilus assembly protein PilP [Nitrococcus sp.]|nr:pilus assembly protein PilP [Nitrococcus sp.]
MSSSPGHRRLPAALALLALLPTALLVGCSQDMHDLRSYIQEVKRRPGGPIAPIPEMKPFTTFSYPDAAVRDPFAPLAFGEPEQTPNRAQSGPRPDPTRPKEALEQYPLDSLAFVGTLQRGQQIWALIRDPGGTIHRVQVGNYMGQHYGRIVAISPTSIEVTELIPNQQGGWVQHAASLAMND